MLCERMQRCLPVCQSARLLPPATAVVAAAPPGERGHSVDAVRIAHDDLMSFFDSDKSGTISFNEFVLMVRLADGCCCPRPAPQ